MVSNPLSVKVLPGLGRLVSGVLLVEADQKVVQFAADRLNSQQGRQLGEVDEPIRIPARPVIIGAVYDPEDTMMGLTCLVQEAADRLHCGGHFAYSSMPGAPESPASPMSQSAGICPPALTYEETTASVGRRQAKTLVDSRGVQLSCC